MDYMDMIIYPLYGSYRWGGMSPQMVMFGPISLMMRGQLNRILIQTFTVNLHILKTKQKPPYLFIVFI